MHAEVCREMPMFDRVTGWMIKFIRRNGCAGKMVEVMLGDRADL